jgi:hypothetical protein
MRFIYRYDINCERLTSTDSIPYLSVPGTWYFTRSTEYTISVGIQLADESVMKYMVFRKKDNIIASMAIINLYVQKVHYMHIHGSLSNGLSTI